MNCSGVKAGEDDAVMLHSLVSSYFDTEGSKVVAGSIVEGGVCGARRRTGRSAINCVSALWAISQQVTHLNFTALLSLLASRIQYFRLVLAVVVATPGCS